MQFWHAFSNFSLRVPKDLLISIFETNFPQLCSAHWERAFDEETLFIGQQFLILIRLFHNFPAKETWKSSYFAAWTQCFSHYESFMYSCGIPWPLEFAQVFGRLSVLSNTLFWLRSVNWLIDFLRNSLDNLASFKSFDDSCCSAFSSFLHGLLRFARVLERLNDDALFNHILKFGWGVRPFSDDFWAEETWLFQFRNLLFCSRYFNYYFRPKIGICWNFWWAFSGYLFLTSNVFLFCVESCYEKNLFLSK